MNKQEQKKEEPQRIRFRDLSFWLRIGIVGGVYSIAALLAYLISGEF